ncbi:TPA: hypothetical protein N0F65_009653 [Lagenidium giganteum]|uniref:VTT domain-containing protein n=1 Tax=Lagenidium giganteum TaxID=4803 RepID=A0AAV2YEW4_9STRA|nr:TPA: hypothetical protein N0F65_009653 [Lagenidium giganteum]
MKDGEKASRNDESTVIASAALAEESNPMADAVPTTKRWQRVSLGLAVTATVVALSVVIFHFLHSDKFDRMVQWLQVGAVIYVHSISTDDLTHTHVQANQGAGCLLYVLGFITCIVLCFPSTAFELLAGYIFGFWLGLLLATTGKLTGSVLSFCIGRYLCRQRVRSYMERGHPFFRAFRSLLRKKQVLLVFLTRIAFFPIAMKNYGLSVLEVSFPVFFSAALLTGLPFSLIWVYSGHAAQHLTTLLAHGESLAGSTQIAMLVVGALSALGLLCFIGVYTRRHILAMAEQESHLKDDASELESDSLRDALEEAEK